MRKIIVALVFVSLHQFCFAEVSWQQVEPGLNYAEVSNLSQQSWGRVHVFEVDPDRYKLDLVFAKEQAHDTATARQFAVANRALIAVNGGFFTPEGQPIGLRVKSGKIKHKIHNTHWWGVFYMQGKKAKIVAKKHYKHRRNIQFAIQSGPRLIVAGKIPKLKPGRDQRTALGINKKGNIIIIVTEHHSLSTFELARLMLEHLNCQYALNLDGGSSSQLFALVGDLQITVPGLSSVSDAVLVLPRK